MTPAGWLFMLASTVSVTGLTAWCFYRVLSKPDAAGHMHAPLDMDTKDLDT